jgi:hypothetical protein
LSEFKNVSRIARAELVQTLSEHLASDILIPDEFIEKKRRFSISTITKTLTLTRQKTLSQPIMNPNPNPDQTPKTLSKRMSTLFRIKKPPSIQKPTIILPPGPESDPEDVSKIPTVLISKSDYEKLTKTIDLLKGDNEALKRQNVELKAGINVDNGEDFQEVNFDGDLSSWETDLWRLTMLKKFSR